jgi:NAD+ synthase (glutamine-hydrolysing)
MISSIIRLTCGVNKVSIGDPAACLDEALRMLEGCGESDITVLPKLALCSASCGSLFGNPLLKEGCGNALEILRERTRERAGYLIVGLALDDWGRTVSAMAVLYRGELVALIPTMDNPSPFLNSGFSGRYLPPETVFSCGALRFCVLACNPLALPLHGVRALQNGCDLVIVPAYQPIRAGLADEIAEGAKSLSSIGGCAVAVVNGGAGDTSSPWLYAGFSMVYECGELLMMQLAGCESMTGSVDLDADVITSQKKLSAGASPVHEIGAAAAKPEVLRPVRRNPFLPAVNPERYLSELFDLQVRSLAARMMNIGSLRLIVGVSGGIDSTAALLVAAGAVDFLGYPRECIIGVGMPGLGTSDRTHDNARLLMEALGVTVREVPIGDSVLRHLRDIGHDGRPDTAFENAQARERTQVLMDIANMEGGFVVGTGDLSEEALGFSTFGGDHLASYNVNVCITKTMLRELLGFLAKTDLFAGDAANVIGDVLATPVSPELLPPDEAGEINQRTEDILGPYELHDFFLYYFVKYRMRPGKIHAYACAAFAGCYNPDFIRQKLVLFLRRFCGGQFKRACAPDAASITEVNLCGVNYYIPSDLSAEMLIRDLSE